MLIRPESKADGGGLFVRILVGTILTFITLGIYGAWFYVNLIKYVAKTTRIGHPNGGDWTFSFEGTGLQFLGKMIIGGLLTLLTLGIYFPWFIIDLADWVAENTTVMAPDGSRREVKFNGRGGEAFMVFFVSGLLTYLTLGLYGPWMISRASRFWAEHTTILDRGEQVGTFEFNGNGEDFFVKFIVGVVLTIVTLGIYAPWFQVTLWKFIAQHSTFKESNRTWTTDFTGTGLELWLKLVIGTILTIVTLGIYAPWWLASLIRWKVGSTEISTSSVD